MTSYKQQDVILVDFGFTEGAGSKKRPALIISSDSYHKSRQEIIIAAITSNTKRVLFGDTKITGWQDAGLLYPSLVTAIIRTIKSSLIIRKIGILSKADFQEVEANIRKALQF
jgi:mRNA interferase MazF